jgi:hypothetical protein
MYVWIEICVNDNINLFLGKNCFAPDCNVKNIENTHSYCAILLRYFTGPMVIHCPILKHIFNLSLLKGDFPTMEKSGFCPCI